MKLLFLANRVPYPPYRGDKLKIYNLARRLRQRHELHLLTFAQSQEDLAYLPDLERVFHQVHLIHLPRWRSALNCLAGLWQATPLQVLYFHSAAMCRRLDELLATHTYDAVHVQHLRMSPYLAANKTLPRILDLPDAFSLYWERRKAVKRGPISALFQHLEQRRLLQFESIIREYDLSLVCSAEDKAYLENLHQVHNIRLLHNGVDLQTFAPRTHDYTHNHTLLFTGNMDYAPNVDAVIHFTQNILPLVQAKYPDVQFVIAGQRPVKKVQELAGRHVSVTGFVKDLAGTYNNASVVVAPLRFGAGTQNKVLEAMAMGVPVVCSQIGFAGLGIQSGEGAIMRTDPVTFANAIKDLLASAEMRQKVGNEGIRVIRENFDWDIVAGQLEAYFKEVAGREG